MSFVQRHGPISPKVLSSHTGWSETELVTLWEKIALAGFGSNAETYGVTEKGRVFLEKIGLDRNSLAAMRRDTIVEFSPRALAQSPGVLTSPPGVLLVDSQVLVRDAIQVLLERHGAYAIVGSTGEALDAVRKARELQPELILMETQLPGISGLEVLPELLKFASKTRVMMLSGAEDRFSVIAAIQAGARAYVPKSATASELLIAMGTVMQGGTYLSPIASAHLADRLQRGRNETALEPEAIAKLTPRERQIVRMIAEGHSTKEIAVVLNLGVNTIRTHRRHLMEKLGLSSAVALTRWALSHGLAAAPRMLGSSAK